MRLVSDERHMVTNSTLSGPRKKSSLSKGLCFCERYAEDLSALVQKVFVSLKDMRKVFVHLSSVCLFCLFLKGMQKKIARLSRFCCFCC